MRVVMTGQVGLDKKPFLQRVCELARQHGQEPAVFHVGDMMYAEAPDAAPGRILDMPLSRLRGLRRSVFKDILAARETARNIVVNTHATFRWRHGLFYAFDYDQMKALDADLYVVLVDNVDRVHYRLVRDGHADHTLKDIMVWREEEILATELLAQIVSGHGRCFILARGGDDGEQGASAAAETMFRLCFQPACRKVYLSFPMSHLGDRPDALAETETFRRTLKRYFACFDPADVEEKHLARLAVEAAEEGRRTVETGPPGRRAVMDIADLLAIVRDIDGQIYARDFKLIDQADMIVSLVPALADGRPALSSGVERELQHAHEATREVFVIWRPRADPSPFVTATATRIFRSLPEALGYFQERGYVPAAQAGALFA